jgi:hypothetical protein
MSRSYRTAIYTEGYGTNRRRYNKRQANKRVRQTIEIAAGNAYRKVTNPWDICDYRLPYIPGNSCPLWQVVCK